MNSQKLEWKIPWYKITGHSVGDGNRSIVAFVEVEGILRNDKILSDGRYYNTIIMGRLHG